MHYSLCSSSNLGAAPSLLPCQIPTHVMGNHEAEQARRMLAWDLGGLSRETIAGRDQLLRDPQMSHAALQDQSQRARPASSSQTQVTAEIC